MTWREPQQYVYRALPTTAEAAAAMVRTAAD
jgi:hypothetical protein